MPVTPQDEPVPEPQSLQDKVAEARAAAARSPSNHPALIQAAHAAFPTDRALALTLAREALPLAGNTFESLRSLSGLFDFCGDRETAIETGRAATALRPDDSEARRHLGGLLLTEGHVRAAVLELAAHVSLPGATPLGWFLLSVALQRSGESRRALDAAARALDDNSPNMDPVLHYVGLLGSFGHYGDAQDVLRNALAKHPREPRLWHALSSLQETLGELPEALASAEEATALAPEDTALGTYRDHIAGQLNLARSAPPDDLASPWMVRNRQQRTRPPRHHPTGVREQLAQRCRVIHALLLWEMRSRYARSRLGYFWGVMEPLGHILTIGLMFSIMRPGHAPIGNDIFVFYVTGVCPYLLFARVSEDVAQGLHTNKPTLQLPAVRTLDVVLARSLLTWATELVSIAVLLSLFALLGRQAWPNNFGQCLTALGLLWLFAIGVGLTNLVVREYVASFEFLWQAFVRLLYFSSGIYYAAISMPPAIRNILMWNPILQGIEWFRTGFFRGYEPAWLDQSYFLQAVLFTLLLGLTTERVARPRLLRQIAT